MFRIVKSFVTSLLVSILLAMAFAGVASADQAQTTVSSAELEKEIEARLSKVEQFKFIRLEAEKRGLRVFLFGGTAAGFAHYVKADMKRERGDTSYQREHFDYDYTSIYRSTQDLDVVVDGDMKLLSELASVVMAKYPHVQGTKSQWEFRPLRQQVGRPGEAGYKEAILGSSDFMNQHTDSNSTGLIELTKPVGGEPVVRDVRDWNSYPSQFLRDVTEGKIKYYFSATHETTARYQAGDNPALFSAVRYLTKAFQFGLDMTSEDLNRVEKIIADFDASKDLTSPRAQSWLLKNGKKLVQHAVDVEYAFGWIEMLGLKDKIGRLDDPRQVESLAWWLNKKPLTTSALGKGAGKTAQELGITIVAHETRSLTALESITRSRTGKPNVFVSRTNASGETAMMGEGFYTRIGRVGAAGTGQTIRFTVNPQAREGTDFYQAGNDYVVFTNAAAIRVIQESLTSTPLEYFERLARNVRVDRSELGLEEGMKARMRTKISALSAKEIADIDKVVETAIDRRAILPDLYEQWLLLPTSKSKLEMKKKLALGNLVEGKMATIASELVDLNLTYAEAKKLAYGPTIEADMSVVFRRKALAQATTAQEVLDLMKPARERLGTLEGDEFKFALTKKPGMNLTTRLAYHDVEMTFLREASSKLWTVNVEEVALGKLIFGLDLKPQWHELVMILASTAPTEKAAQVVLNLVQKIELMERFHTGPTLDRTKVLQVLKPTGSPQKPTSGPAPQCHALFAS